MPQPCTICTHPERASIDAALATGAPNRRIAAQHGITEQAVRRHKDGHFPEMLAKAEAAQEAARADDLLAQMRDLQETTLAILTRADEARDNRTALWAIREARGNLELLAKLAGQLQQEGTINLTVNTEWLEIRAVLQQVLAPFPEARAAVAQALLEVNRAGQ